MNAFSLALASIRARRMNAALCMASAAAGIAVLTLVFMLSQSIDRGLSRNARGVDVIVGAKGSGLQLVLSALYHADVPNGNIDMKDMDWLRHNPQVKETIPITIGDNYQGFHIVGTTPDYLNLYHAQLAQGSVFGQPFEAVAGADTGLAVGAQFAAVHGLAMDSDDVHNFHKITIKGILKPTGTVLDRLIITPYESVQALHDHPDAGDPDADAEHKLARQITAVLVKVSSPIGVINLPRQINRMDADMMAASPAYEMTRFSTAMGFSREILTALGTGFVSLSALMLFSALASSLAARRYDLAVLRVLGASPALLFLTVMIEGLLLSGAGAALGIFLGHAGAYALAINVPTLQSLVIPADLISPQPLDLWFIGIGLAIGAVAGIVPALAGARTDISGLLARGRA